MITSQLLIPFISILSLFEIKFIIHKYADGEWARLASLCNILVTVYSISDCKFDSRHWSHLWQLQQVTLPIGIKISLIQYLCLLSSYILQPISCACYAVYGNSMKQYIGRWFSEWMSDILDCLKADFSMPQRLFVASMCQGAI